MSRKQYIPTAFKLHIFKKELQFDAYIWDLQVAGRTQYCAVVWTGNRQIKPALYSFYRTEAQREAAVTSLLNRAASVKIAKSERRAAHGSWGYEQTNCEFYQVVDVPSAQYVTVRKVANLFTENGFMTGRNMPSVDSFRGEPLRRKVIDNYVKIDQSTRVSRWDGTPKHSSHYG
jgi:hypothetical protein